MALIVESGAGLPSADAYISLTFFKTYCSQHNYRVEEAEDFAIEAAIRLATGWIDTYNRYKGSRLLAEQALEFPRADLIDWSSHPVTGVPHRLKHACAELAYKALSQSLYSDLDRGGMVQSESVGPISVTYAAGAPPGKVWQYAQKILEQYIRDPLDFNGPLWTTPDTGYQFTIGMNDTPGDVSTEYE